MGHLARNCKEEYQDPRIAQNNNPKYPYRKNFTQQPEWRNNTNWAPRYFDNRYRNMNDNYTPPDSNNQNWRSTNKNNPQQTYKENYFKSTQQNNNWNNVQNTRTGTHESQKKNMSIQMLDVDIFLNIRRMISNTMTTQPWSMKTQKITFGMTVTTTDINHIPTIRCQLLMKITHMKLKSVITLIHHQEIIPLIIRLDYTPLNLSHEGENNLIQQEIKNLRDNHKRMTHEINCLQD